MPTTSPPKAPALFAIAAPALPATAAPAPPRSVDSHELLGGATELLIQHQAQTYRLRQTAQGKLILTK